MRMKHSDHSYALAALSVLILTGFLADPQLGEPAAFPTKPIEMTVLFGAGSGADLLARKLAEVAGKDLGQPILVVNRTGAGGAIGYNYLRGQAADGYAVVWNSNSISTAYHAGNMNFDYTTFSGVAELTTEPVSLAVKTDAPWKAIGEFIAYAKTNPGKIRIGNSGRGSFTHLTGVALENLTGAKVIHVPFGQALAVATVLGEKIEASIQLPAEIVSQVRGKQVRILAVTGEKRLPSLPDAPTFKEMGIDLTLSLWRGIAVPKGTPEAVIGRLETAFKAASESQAFRDFATEMGASMEFRGAKAFDPFMAAQDKELAGLMDQIGMKKQ